MSDNASKYVALAGIIFALIALGVWRRRVTRKLGKPPAPKYREVAVEVSDHETFALKNDCVGLTAVSHAAAVECLLIRKFRAAGLQTRSLAWQEEAMYQKNWMVRMRCLFGAEEIVAEQRDGGFTTRVRLFFKEAGA